MIALSRALGADEGGSVIGAPEMDRLGAKATETRRRILDTALQLFASKGYEHTTMRDIATLAGCSLGLTYRYFASKEDLALELYRWLVIQLEQQTQALPVAPLADRFDQLMRGLLGIMAPHRLTLIALAGAALNPLSRAGVFGADGAEMRRRARAAYLDLVAGATDAPRGAQRGHIATVLYGAQLGLVLLWLQDLTEGGRQTKQLLDFIHEQFTRFWPLARLPMVAHALASLVTIIGPTLGDNLDT